MSPRHDARKDFDVSTRIALIEADVDEFEVALAALANELGGIRKVLIGLLVSISTACVLLAINISMVSR